MRHFELRPEDYRPAPPPAEIKEQVGIGIVGCGGIMRSAHLPAYRDFGYRVLACSDIVEENMLAAQRQFNIPFGTTNVDELLERDDIQVIDLAVHAIQRPPLVDKISKAGKHILSQKPFAMNWADAAKMVALCEERGVTLMVNQQARWAPAHRALKLVVESGVLGHLYSVMHINRSFQDQPGSWYVALENFNIVDHGIHYIDLSRYLTGRTPLRVKATTTMVPGQVAVTPMIYTILCEYEPEAQVMSTLHFNNIIQTRAMHRYEWFLDGTLGSVSASQSELLISFKDLPEQKQVYAIQGRWFPDAFGGSMGEMLRALAEKREPQTSGRDNLNSIRIAYAAVESSRSGRTVELAEIGK
jgi:predicted dehydrogenase